MNCNQLTVTSFIAVEDCELSEIHLNDTHQMQQIIDLYGADSTEMTHLFTGLSSENRVALHLSVSALNNGDIRVDGHIQLTTGQENGWQAVEGETLFSVFVPKDRVVSRTLSVVRNHTQNSFATLLITFRNQAQERPTTSAMLVRRTLSTVALCGLIGQEAFQLDKLEVVPIQTLAINSQETSVLYQGTVLAVDEQGHEPDRKQEVALELKALVLANGQVKIHGIIQLSKIDRNLESCLIEQRAFVMMVSRDRYVSRTVFINPNGGRKEHILLMLCFQNGAI